MRVAHVLRKYNPDEWGGTESSVHGLLQGLSAHQVSALVYCPKLREPCSGADPLRQAGHQIKRFRAWVPVCRVSRAQRRQLVSIGGNLLSLDLPFRLWREPGLSVIHTHTLNRLGGAALTAARWRRVPFVVTVHGGALDLPEEVRRKLSEPLRGGWEWGKAFGALLRSRSVLDAADAVVTCNRREGELLSKRYPCKKIVVQPHGVQSRCYQPDHRAEAATAFPEIGDRPVLLCIGRIDPVKNQAWVVQQLPALLARFPRLLLVLAGSCTDETYGKQIKKEVRNLGLENCVLLTGGLPPLDPRLIGLLQRAAAVVLPSLSETFGLVILEAWAAGTPVLSTPTSGALDLLRHGEDGWVFDLTDPGGFHRAVARTFEQPAEARLAAEAGQRRARTEFDLTALAGRIKGLYAELIEEKSR